MEECVLLKGKTSEEEHLQKVILAVRQLSEGERSEGVARVVPPPGHVLKNRLENSVLWGGRWVSYPAGACR